ncbi:hypothetical protein ACE6H2_005107 [Prunus campanulata]
MLYIVGLGLADEKDITIRGLEIVKQCDQFFRRNFNAQENLYGKPVTVTDRKTVEEKADQILTADTFGPTTHTDLVVQATKLGIDVESGA